MSRDKTATELSEALFTKLQSETLVLLHTIDAETGAPTSSAISWVYAPDRNKIRFALDQRSRLVNNIRNNEQVALTVFATGTIHSIHGRAQLVTEALEGVPFKLARRVRAPVFTVFCRRVGPARYAGRVEPFPLSAAEDPGRAAAEDAAAFNARLEAAVRENPGHWLWMYDRWKRLERLEEPALRGAQ